MPLRPTLALLPPALLAQLLNLQHVPPRPRPIIWRRLLSHSHSRPQMIQRRQTFRPRKAPLILTPAAVSRLRVLSSGPVPQLIRIGVRNKGCAGMSYHLEYVDTPAKFDEIVEQDGVQVLIDSKALFSIIGSEMDWTEDRISSKFSFKNPNVRDSCGCGESFTT